MLRLPADSSTMKRSPGRLVDDHLAEGADVVHARVGARVGQEHQSGVEFDADAIGHACLRGRLAPVSSVGTPRRGLRAGSAHPGSMPPPRLPPRWAPAPAAAGGGCEQVYLLAAQRLLGLQRGQGLPRVVDHGGRHAGQPRHLDAVAAAGRAGLDLVQEHDVGAGLGGAHVHVDRGVVLRRELGQLEVVRGEQREGLGLVVQVRGDARRPAPGRRRWRCRGRSRPSAPGFAAWRRAGSAPPRSSPA